jgi:hypothetical protein
MLLVDLGLLLQKSNSVASAAMFFPAVLLHLWACYEGQCLKWRSVYFQFCSHFNSAEGKAKLCLQSSELVESLDRKGYIVTGHTGRKVFLHPFDIWCGSKVLTYFGSVFKLEGIDN